MSLMEARKDQLKSELLFLADSAAPRNPTAIAFPLIPDGADVSALATAFK